MPDLFDFAEPEPEPMARLVATVELVADPCAGKHGGAETSVAAWDAAAPHAESDCQQVLNWLGTCATLGLTADEFAIAVGKPLNAVSGRFSQLKARGLIVARAKNDGQDKRATRTGSLAQAYVLAAADTRRQARAEFQGTPDAMRDRR